jgi:hypothetical protein
VHVITQINGSLEELIRLFRNACFAFALSTVVRKQMLLPDEIMLCYTKANAYSLVVCCGKIYCTAHLNPDCIAYCGAYILSSSHCAQQGRKMFIRGYCGDYHSFSTAHSYLSPHFSIMMQVSAITCLYTSHVNRCALSLFSNRFVVLVATCRIYCSSSASAHMR